MGAPPATYRYRITASWGAAEHLAVGSHIVERQYMGLRHTWTVMDLDAGEVTGSFSGVYVGRFHARDAGEATR